METLSSIVSDLTSISNSLGLEGPVINAEIQLLANSIYKNELVAINTVLEASPTRCTKLNSAIKHAYDSQYSVPRGSNQRIKINNITPLTSKNVKMFDLLGKVDNYRLYYAQDYRLDAGTPPEEIEVIVGKELVEEPLNILNITYLSSTNTDISEDVMLFKNGVKVDVTSRFTEFGKGYDYLALTSTDYGVDIYASSNFIAGDTYLLKYIPYLTSGITDPNSVIKQLPDFNFIYDKATGKQLTTFESVDPIKRLESTELIAYNTMVVKRTAFTIKSKTDLTDLITNFFVTELAGVNVVIDTTITDEHPNGVIYVYYLMESLTANLPQYRIDEFNKIIKKAYYVVQDIEFVHATAVVPDKDIVFTIYYSSQLLPTSVNEIVYKYNYNIGQPFNVYKVMADLISSLPAVSYIDVGADSLISLGLNSNEHINISANFKPTYANALTLK